MKKSVFEVNDIHTLANAQDLCKLSFPKRSKRDEIYNKARKYNGKFNTAYRTIVTSQHASDRWNERVGPEMPPEELSNLVAYIFKFEPHRVEMIHEKLLDNEDINYCIIDNDIVAIHTVQDDSLVIRTFLGRISLKPQLQDVTSLYKFITLAKDNTDLYVPYEILAAQTIPFGPIKAAHIENGSTRYYQFEFSNATVINKVSFPKGELQAYEYKTVILNHIDNNKNLSITDLSVILGMNNKKFVASYIAANYKTIPELSESYSNRAFQKFIQRVNYGKGVY